MEKYWKRTGETQYGLYIDNVEVGTLDLAVGTAAIKATVKMANDTFIIQRTGFWKSSVEILASDGQAIANAYYEKWYGNSFVLEYKDKKYKLVIRNNPLAEWAILDGLQVILAYGFKADHGNTSIRITSPAHHSEHLLDFLLWYLFLPIATENAGDHFLFMMMLTNQ